MKNSDFVSGNVCSGVGTSGVAGTTTHYQQTTTSSSQAYPTTTTAQVIGVGVPQTTVIEAESIKERALLPHGHAQHYCAQGCKSYVVGEYQERINLGGTLNKEGLIAETASTTYQERVGVTTVLEKQHHPDTMVTQVPVEVKTVKETPPTREVVHGEKKVNVTEAVTVSKVYGIPGCTHCNGTGLIKKMGGEPEGCWSCAEQLKITQSKKMVQ